MKNDDSELIQRTLDGDQHAFTLLVEKYQKQVHTLAWQKIGDYHIAQEITQDVFITAYQKFPTLKHYRQFPGWLYVVTNRKCISWHRKKKIKTQSIDQTNSIELEKAYFTDYTEHQREEAAKEARRTIVKKLLSTLKESDRTVIKLYYLAEMSCEEISEFLGVSPNTVRSRLHRARNRLKKDEAMIKENLSSFQLPTQFTETIMEKISQLNPVSPSGSKPLVPLAVSAVSAILVLFLLGIGAQNQVQYQQPYSLDAASEATIEIVDAQILLESPTTPNLKNRVGSSNITNNSNGTGQNPDTTPNAAKVENGISNDKGKWIETKGPVGGAVPNLFATSKGDLYAGTPSGIYRLADNKKAWKHINSRNIFSHRKQLSGMRSGPMIEKDDILYLATNKELLSSSDQGLTWKTISVHPGGEIIGIVITDHAFYLSITNGLYRSEDIGVSWVEMTPFNDEHIGGEIHAIASIKNILFVGTNVGLFRLIGDEWDQISFDHIDKNNKNFPIITVEVRDNLLYVARSYNIGRQNFDPKDLHNVIQAIMQERDITGLSWSLFISSDHGGTWKNITPKKDNIDKEKLSVVDLFKSNGNKKKENKKSESQSSYKAQVYNPLKLVATENNVLVIDKMFYFSSNSGNTWRTLDNVDNIRNVLSIVNLNENTYYISGSFGIYRTTDIGKTWNQFNSGLVNTDVWQLIAINGTIYANTISGFVYSTDEGESWSAIKGDTGFITRIVEDNGEIYVRDDKNGTPRIFQLSKKEKNLKAITDMPQLDRIDPYNDNRQLNRPTGYMVNHVWHGDGSFPESQLGGINVENGVYYVEYNYHLYRWKPNALKWFDTGILDKGLKNDKSILHTANRFIDTVGFKFAISGNTVYIGKKDRQLMQSLYEGLTWTDLTGNLPFPVEYYKTITFSDDFVYVATDKGVVISENGTDWHILTDAGGNALIMNMLAVNDGKVFGVANRFIYQGNSDTHTWHQVTPKIPYAVTCIDVDDDILYVGTKRRGVLRYKLDK